jgi:hypothetical protein
VRSELEAGQRLATGIRPLTGALSGRCLQRELRHALTQRRLAADISAEKMPGRVDFV